MGRSRQRGAAAHDPASSRAAIRKHRGRSFGFGFSVEWGGRNPGGAEAPWRAAQLMILAE
jgi:hypothetical protein